jgi:hypothetical protein
VIVVEGGEVQSIGSGTCLEGTICMVEVNNTNFSESFTAVPKVGWAFVKWNTGEGFFCGDSTDPTCVLSTIGTDGNAGIESIIASDQTFYVMPDFRPGLSDTISVAGKEWAPVDPFTNLSWSQMNAACPDGICDGVLNGYDMTDWTWASVDDVNALLNHYIVSHELGPGPDYFADYENRGNTTWATAFYNDGWHATHSTIRYIAGWMHDKRPGYGGMGEFIDVLGTDGPYGDLDRVMTQVLTLNSHTKEAASSGVGGWFFLAP